MKSLIILGRQPALGIAELESFFDAKEISPIRPGAVLLDKDPGLVPFSKLGGSIKLARVIATLHTTNWRELEQYIAKTIPELLEFAPEGKLKLGLSTYNLNVGPKDINSAGLRLKKLIKSSGRSVRIVPNKSSALNSAQVLHNQLTSEKGIEIVLIRKGNSTILAQTISEQDIEAYAKRDQNRPMRDAKVGMLPPKLAQIIINLAGPIENEVILDPFCGTGVVIQESLLMGHDAVGTDIDTRMIEYAEENVNKWLIPNWNIFKNAKFKVGDATKFNWVKEGLKFDIVAGETYLGKPLTSLPPKALLDNIIAECDQIHDAFLKNIASQLKSGTRLCLAVPAWKSKNSFLHLKTLDQLSKLGYNRLSFVHATNSELIYHRPDQTVARELVVLEKK